MNTIKVYLVDGSAYDFEMSDNEMVYRLIGDDFAAPPSGNSIIQKDRDGKETKVGFSYDPKKNKRDNSF